MFERLEAIEKRYIELEQKLADLGLIGDKGQYQKLVKEFSDIEELAKGYRRYKSLSGELAELEVLLQNESSSDPEFTALVRKEIPRLKEKIVQAEQELARAMQRGDKDEEMDMILEIRAGTGGDEAGIFVGDFFLIYF